MKRLTRIMLAIAAITFSASSVFADLQWIDFDIETSQTWGPNALYPDGVIIIACIHVEEGVTLTITGSSEGNPYPVYFAAHLDDPYYIEGGSMEVVGSLDCQYARFGGYDLYPPGGPDATDWDIASVCAEGESFEFSNCEFTDCNNLIGWINIASGGSANSDVSFQNCDFAVTSGVTTVVMDIDGERNETVIKNCNFTVVESGLVYIIVIEDNPGELVIQGCEIISQEGGENGVTAFYILGADGCTGEGIVWNQITNCALGFDLGSTSPNISNNWIEGCKIGVWFNGEYDGFFLNNVIDGNGLDGTTGIFAQLGDFADDIIPVYNCIIMGCDLGVQGGDDADTLKYCCVDNSNTVKLSGCTGGTGYTTDTPNFAPNNDRHLTYNNPNLINSGTGTDSDGSTADISLYGGLYADLGGGGFYAYLPAGVSGSFAFVDEPYRASGNFAFGSGSDISADAGARFFVDGGISFQGDAFDASGSSTNHVVFGENSGVFFGGYSGDHADFSYASFDTINGDLRIDPDVEVHFNPSSVHVVGDGEMIVYGVLDMEDGTIDINNGSLNLLNTGYVEVPGGVINARRVLSADPDCELRVNGGSVNVGTHGGGWNLFLAGTLAMSNGGVVTVEDSITKEPSTGTFGYIDMTTDAELTVDSSLVAHGRGVGDTRISMNHSTLDVGDDLRLSSLKMTMGNHSRGFVHGHLIMDQAVILMTDSSYLLVGATPNVVIQMVNSKLDVDENCAISKTTNFENDTLIIGTLELAGACTVEFNGGTYLEIDSLYTTGSLVKFDTCSGTIGWLVADTSAHIIMTSNCDVNIETGLYLLDNATINCRGVAFTDLDSGIVVSNGGTFDICTFHGTDVVQTGGDLDIDSCAFEDYACFYLDSGGVGITTDITDCDFDDGYLWMKKPNKDRQTIDHCVFEDQTKNPPNAAAYFTDGSVAIEHCGFYDMHCSAISMNDCDSDISTTLIEDCGDYGASTGAISFYTSDAQIWCSGVKDVDGIGIKMELASHVTLRDHDTPGKPPKKNPGYNEIFGEANPTNVVKLMSSGTFPSYVYCDAGYNRFEIDTSQATVYYGYQVVPAVDQDVAQNQWYDLDENDMTADSANCSTYFTPTQNWDNWWNPYTGSWSSCLTGYSGRLDEGEGGGTPVEGEIAILFHEGLVAVDEGNYEEAFAKFREVIEDYPEDELTTTSLKRLFWAARENDLILLEEESQTPLEMPTVLGELEDLRDNTEGSLVSFARIYVPQAKVAMGDYEGALAEYRNIINNPQSEDEEIHARIDSQRIALYITGTPIFAFGESSQLRNARQAVARLRALRGLGQQQNEMLAGLDSDEGSPSPGRISGKLLIPERFELQQCYPNPFNPITVIKFALPQDANVRLDVFNIIGQKVVTLMDKPMVAGWYSTEFDGSDLASGVYIYRLEAGPFVDSRKMVLIR